MNGSLVLAAGPWWAAGFTATRWVTYSAVLLAAGGALFLVAVHDGEAAERRLLAALVTAAAIVAVLGTVLAVPLHAVDATGSVAGATDPVTLAAVGASATGTSSLIRLGGLAVLLAAVPASLGGGGRIPLVLGGAVAALSYLFAGHTLTAQPGWVATIADGCHVLAAAVWFGGLVLLTVVLHRRGRDDVAVRDAAVVARFSTVATAALPIVAVAGVALAWVEIRTLDALRGSGYGQTLVIKAFVVGAVAAIGGYNNRYLVARISRAANPDTGGDEVRAWRRLSTTVRLEVIGLVVVLAVTAALVHRAPPRPHLDGGAHAVGTVPSETLERGMTAWP